MIIDETLLSLDGSVQKQGGMFYDRSLPIHGLIASKMSQSTIMITGSNAFWGSFDSTLSVINFGQIRRV